MSDEHEHFIVMYDDYGHQLRILHIAHSEGAAKLFVYDREGYNDVIWEHGEIEQMEGEMLLYCFGDAQYVIMPKPTLET